MRPGLAGASRNRLPVEHERLDRFEQLQAREIPPAGQGEAIVDFRHLGAQAADVDRKFAEQLLAPEAVNHRQRFLRFAEREDRHEHATALRKRARDCFRQPPFLGRARETFRQRIDRRASSR